MDELMWMRGPLWAPDSGGSGGGEDQDPGDSGSGSGDGDGDGGTKNMVPITRLNEVIQERNDLRAQIKKSESTVNKLQAEIKKLQDAGKSEQEQLQDRLASLEGDLKTERHERLRLQVASRHQIPEELIDRLRGEDEEALEADAEALKAFIKVENQDQEDEKNSGGPGNPPARKGGRGKKGYSIEGKSAKEIRDAFKSGKLSLSG